MRVTFCIALVLVVAGLPAAAGGDDWPQFRGPNGSATSADKDLPATWDGNKNVAWKSKLPGYSWSSPVLWGDKVLVTTAAADKQQKPTGGFGGPPGGFGGPGGFGPPGGRPGGFGGLPPPGQILASFVQDRLKMTAEQKKALEEFQ